MTSASSLAKKIVSFPRKPGVYLFKDAGGVVLYVGKAKRLRDRVQSYCIEGRDLRPQVAFLIKRAVDIDYIVTASEKEALLLENTLIKEYHPRYNIHFRDDKSYVSIRLGREHEVPGVALTRRVKKDGARYFGPYESAAAAREAVEQIIRFIRLRSCSDREYANRIRPCMEYDIGRCTAPCVGRVSRDDYAAQVEEGALFLTGCRHELLHRLEARMALAAEGQHYEEAARLRDAIALLHRILEKQTVVRHHGGTHDAVGFAREGGRIAICVFSVRDGALISRRLWQAPETVGDDSAVLAEFLLQHYEEKAVIPPRILLPQRIEGIAEIQAILMERREGAVAIAVPLRGPMRKLLDLAEHNAREALARKAREKSDIKILERLGQKLKLRTLPEAIECVDISNLSGREAMGSIVAFVHGLPDKSRYRLYTIRSLATPDDFAMMVEVLSRRFRAELPLRGVDTRPPMPDLLLVDGGKGQLAVAGRALAECGVKLPLAAIAKGEGNVPDRIFLPGRKNPLNLRAGSPELLFLQRIRDEAHRFGLSAHRRKRSCRNFDAAGYVVRPK
jgi:excinuclease ABC subunit C